jgi:hypothetical protein
MEVLHSSAASVNFYWTTQRCIAKDRTLHSHRCEHLDYNAHTLLRTVFVLKFIAFAYMSFPWKPNEEIIPVSYRRQK